MGVRNAWRVSTEFIAAKSGLSRRLARQRLILSVIELAE